MTLTRPQIEAEPAGFTLDSWVAAAIGWTDIAGSDVFGYTGLRPGFPPGFVGHVAIPAFSTDLAAAMTLLEGWSGNYEISRNSGHFTVNLGQWIWGMGDTLPLACVRARLIAVEMQKEGK